MLYSLQRRTDERNLDAIRIRLILMWLTKSLRKPVLGVEILSTPITRRGLSRSTKYDIKLEVL